MNMIGFSDLTFKEWRATSAFYDCTKSVHTKKPSNEPSLPMGAQKPGQDIWDWLGVTKPNKKVDSNDA